MARDRRQYFDQLAATSRKYYIPYLSRYMKIGEGVNVLEIGCGEGGNLLPFAQAGCSVLGVDLSEGKIRAAGQFFAEAGCSVPGVDLSSDNAETEGQFPAGAGAQARFLASDIFDVKELEGQFDLILCHDVIEHIADKEEFLRRVKAYLKPGTGLAFIAFPAWQMPFGGHQQMCTNRRLARLPYFHLLPSGLYRRILERGGESPAAIAEFLEIKRTATPIELFERMLRRSGLQKIDRRLWLINPHYEAKFGLRPRRLPRLMGGIPWLRNFYTTSCFYLLK